MAVHAGLSAGALTAYSHEWHLLCTFPNNVVIHLPPFAVFPSVFPSLLTLSVGFQGRSVESLSWLRRSSVTAGSVHTITHTQTHTKPKCSPNVISVCIFDQHWLCCCSRLHSSPPTLGNKTQHSHAYAGWGETIMKYAERNQCWENAILLHDKLLIFR